MTSGRASQTPKEFYQSLTTKTGYHGYALKLFFFAMDLVILQASIHHISYIAGINHVNLHWYQAHTDLQKYEIRKQANMVDLGLASTFTHCVYLKKKLANVMSCN